MDRRSSHTPPEVLSRWIVGALAFLAILLMTVQGFSTGNRMMLLGLAGVPGAILFINRLRVWYMAIFCVFYSWIYIPGLPTSLSVFHLLALGIIPFLFAGKLLGAPAYKRSGWVAASVIGFLVTVLVTMFVRGFGLRSTGSSLWGGAFYVHLIIALLFYLLSNQIILTEKQWRRVIFFFFSMAILPVVAEWVFLLSKGQVFALYYFIKPEGWSARSNVGIISGTKSGILRFQVSKYIAMLLPLSLAVFPFRGRSRILIAVSFLIACLFAGLSGHRSSVVYLLLFIPTVIFFRTRKFPFRLLLFYAIGLATVIGFLAVAGRMLPLSMQRTVSWVPFADISMEARHSAFVTTAWRFELWKQLLDLAPDHWLVGRGLTFDPSQLWMLTFSRQRDTDWAIISHNYHSGPLSLLIDFGGAGLICGSGIMIGGAFRHYRLLASHWNSAVLQRFHSVILASFCVDVFRFYLVVGDAVGSMVAFLVYLTILEGLFRADGIAVEEKTVPDVAEAAPRMTVL